MFAAAIVASNRNAGRTRDLGSMGALQFSGRRSSFSSESSNHLSTGMTVVFVVLSLVLMILGTVYLVSSTSHKREEAVVEYGATVQAWEASERQVFEQLDVLARTVVLDGQKEDTTQNVSVAEHLAENVTMDKLKDVRRGVDLPQYRPLVYRVYGANEGFLPPMSSDSEGKIATKEETKQIDAVLPIFSVELTLKSPEGTTSVLQTSGTSVKRIHKVHARSPDPVNNCWNSQHGEFHYGMCHIRKRLVGICVQVERIPQTDPVQWRLASRSPDDTSSYGCYRSKSGTWDWAKYEDEMLANASRAGVHRKHNKAPSPLVLEVRSAADPLFKALEMTDGQLDFGPSSSDNRAMGLLLLVFGIVLALPACCRLTVLLWPSPDKHDYFSHHDSDEVGMGLTDNSRGRGGLEGEQLGQETQMRDWSVPRSRSPPPLRYC